MRNSIILVAVTVALYFGMVPTALAEPPEWVGRSFEKMKEQSARCSYERVTRGSEESLVERFDARATSGDGWTLVSVDGEAPSAKQQRLYARATDERALRDNPCELELDGLGKVGSYKLVEETPTHLIYAFTPATDDAEDEEEAELLENLDGLLRINRSGPFVESIELRNSRPFSPVAALKVEQLELRTRIERIAPEGPFALVSHRSRLRGRMLFKRFEEDESVTHRALRTNAD